MLEPFTTLVVDAMARAVIRCIIDTANDSHEISLDENVTRENMHPADQFEAFKKLANERGFGAEEIAARFGVAPHVVRQRLRLPIQQNPVCCGRSGPQR